MIEHVVISKIGLLENWPNRITGVKRLNKLLNRGYVIKTQYDVEYKYVDNVVLILHKPNTINETPLDDNRP